MLFPVLGRAKQAARRVQCVGNLHQFGLAIQMYWHDNQDKMFAYKVADTNGGKLFWFGWLQNGAEGHRAFDATQGALYSYVQGRGIEICPSLNYYSQQFKLKAAGAAYGYGVNWYISNPAVVLSRIGHPSQTLLLADAAEVNDFLAPASPDNPMLEENYFVNVAASPEVIPRYPNGHFRHNLFADVLFCDGHIGGEKMVSGSLDMKLPTANVGQIRPEILTNVSN